MKSEKDSHDRLKAAAVILAGGSSTRMGGIAKSDLIFENVTFITRKIRFAEQICSEIIISAGASETGVQMSDSLKNLAGDIPVRIVPDESKGHGPLMGILSALKASRFEVNFITTVDSPFFNMPLARYLIQSLGDNDAHVPIWNGYPEPLFAVYRKSCIPFIHGIIQENRRKIVSFYDRISVKYADSEVVKGYDADGSSFTNINTQEEYRKLVKNTGWKDLQGEERMTDERIYLTAKLTAKPGKFDVLREAILWVLPKSRAEEACVQYDPHTLVEDPDSIMFYEIWADEAGFKAHAASAHLAEFNEMLAGALAGPAELTFLKKLL